MGTAFRLRPRLAGMGLRRRNIAERLTEMPDGTRLLLAGLPFFIFIFIFSYLPLYGWIYAFYDFRPGLGLSSEDFVGLKHFLSLVSDKVTVGEVLRVMRNTLAMSGLGLLASPLPMLFAIFLAEIRIPWIKRSIQSVTTIPHFISWILMFSVVYAMFSLEDGFINNALLRLNLIEEPISFMASDKNVWLKMLGYNLFKTLGWSAVIYLSSMAAIDPELYAVADVDGAGRFGKIWHITIPSLLPTYFVLLVLSIASIVNTGMEQYYVFSNAINRSRIEVLDLYVYNTGLVGRNYSFATAVGLLKSVVSITLLFVANQLSKLVRGQTVV
jgi:putative aldouronate transport system permease protein